MTDTKPEKLKMHSPDLTQDNIARIGELFPGCVTEAKDANGKIKLAVDFDQLRQELSDSIVEGPQERYHLNWPGKREALLAANAPIAKTLRPCREESVDFDTTKNLFIEGDNLEALKLLQETYLGQVKMIYIDPPYNTGKDFIYKDAFAIGSQEYEEATSQRDDAGARLVSNPETSGRYHSHWLSMIYPRLEVAKRLLSKDGLIFISIDDHEQASLKRLCDQIFGENNFIAQLVWEKGRKNDAKLFSVGHEYMLVYARDLQLLRENMEVWREEKPGARDIWEQFTRLKEIHGEHFKEIEKELTKWYSALPKGHPAKKWSRYKRVDKYGPWRDRDISWPGGDGPRYDVIHPITRKPCAVPDGGWRYSSPEEMNRQIAMGLVEFRDDHTEPPFRKAHIRPVPNEFDTVVSDDEDCDTEFATQVRGSYFYKQSQVAVKNLRSLMGAKVFTNPKDHEELAKIISYVTPRDQCSLIMDFFAGSATTAEAVLKANADTGSNHRYICIQLPENLEQSLQSASGSAKQTTSNAISFLKKAGKPLTLTELSKERIRRAGAKILHSEWNENWNGDVGFRVLSVGTSNLQKVYYSPDTTDQKSLLDNVDNIKPDRTSEDLLFQVLLDWGVDLTLPIRQETLQGKTIFFVNETPYDLIACFDTGITEELVKELAGHQPLRVVFRDNGFATDALKINVTQIFKQLSPVTEVKVI